jgi:hypothetical protein
LQSSSAENRCVHCSARLGFIQKNALREFSGSDSTGWDPLTHRRGGNVAYLAFLIDGISGRMNFSSENAVVSGGVQLVSHMGADWKSS